MPITRTNDGLGTSRRDLLRFGVGSLALGPSLAWAGETSTPSSAAPPGDVSARGRSDAERHLQVEVLINSQGPFHFVVDTGADRTVIADDVARRLLLEGERRVMVEGIVKTIPAGTVRIRDLSFGPVQRRDLEIPVLPRALLGADGYLGIDAIDGYCVIFDFEHNSLKVDYSRSTSGVKIIDSGLTRVHADGPYGHLKTLNCDVDGVHATAFVDSGAQVTIGNRELATALLARGGRHADLGSVPITGVTGGSVEGRIAAINHIQLKTLTFNAPKIVIADLQVFDLWDLTHTPALLIGMNYLREFARVSVDYGQKEFRFDLADGWPARSAGQPFFIRA